LVEPFEDRDLGATIQMALYRGKMERSLREANERLEEKVSARTAELQEANRRLQDLFDNAHDLIQAVAPDGTFLFVNRDWCEALGFTEAESSGLNMFDLIAPDCREHCTAIFQRLMQAEDVGLIDVALIAKNGQRVELEGTSSTRFVQGAPVSTRSIFRDVTARRQTESALVRSQRLLKTVTDIVPGMVGYWTTDLTCAFANPGYLKWFGRTAEEMRGIRLQDLLGPIHFERNEPYIRGVLAGKAQQFERQLKQPDGQVGFMWAHYVPDFAADGAVRGFVVLASDITEHKRTEHALREREQMLSSINANLEGTCIYRLIYHPDGRLECAYASPNLEGLLGVSVGRVLEEVPTSFSFVDSDDDVRLRRAAAEAYRTGLPVSLAVRVEHTDGSTRWVEFRSHLVERRPDGSQVHDGIAVDISQVRKAKHDLEAVHQRLALAMRASRTCTWDNDVGANRISLDSAWMEMRGYPPSETVTTTRALLMQAHPQDRARIMAVASRAIRGETEDYRVEHRVSAANGTWLWILSHGLVMGRDVLGRATRIVGTNTDITERKQAELELHDSEVRYQLAVTASRDGVWDWEVKTGRTYYSPRWESMFGFEPGEAAQTLEAFRVLVHPDDLEGMLAEVRRYLRREIPYYSREFRMFHRDGRLRWTLHQAAAIFDETGAPVRLIGTTADITSRKDAEDQVRALNANLEHLVLQRTTELATSNVNLRKTEERFRAVFERSPIIIGLFTVPEGAIVEFNQAAVKALGYTHAEATGRTSRELGIWANPADYDRYLAKLRTKRYVRSFETMMRRKNGEVFPVLYTGSLIDIDGQTFSLNSLQDISAQRESEARFRNVFENAPIGIYRTTPKGEILLANPALISMLGYTSFEKLAERRLDTPEWFVDHPRDEFEARLDRDGEVRGAETAWRRADGTVVHLIENARVIRDAEGKVLYFEGTVEDMTARHEAERALRASEQRYQRVVENITDGLLIEDTAGGSIYANQRFLELFGLTESDLSGLGLEAYIAPEYRAGLKTWRSGRIAEEDGPAFFECEGLRKDGARRWFEIRVSHVVEHGVPIGVQSVVRDITDRRQAENRLRDSEARFHGVFDASPIPILLSSASDGRILEANAASLALFGFSRAETIGRTAGELHLWREDQQRDEFFRRIQQETLVQAFEAIMRTKAGEERCMLCNGTRLTIEGGEFALLSALDITEVRKAEVDQAQIQARAFQNQKFEALGTLAGGVAHDFNNILTGVINYTSLAIGDCPSTHPQITEFLNEVLICGSRAKELVRQILLFSRAEEGQQQPLLLQVVLKETLALLRATLPSTATIECKIESRAPEVIANATQIHQVFLNLGINAAQALNGQPGLITIQLDHRNLDRAAVRALPDLKPGLHVRLEVTDNGCGMEKDVMARIFEPFFTTKPTGEGTGLGLAVVHSIVRSHRGAIAVKSRPGVGTTFELFFPVSPRPARAAASATTAFSWGRGQHILLVDDEPAIVRSVELLLNRLGYRTSGFVDPEAALAKFQAAPDEVHALVTDFQMPGMTGLMLATALRDRKPGIPVIIMSGFLSRGAEQALRDLGIVGIVPKPIEMLDLTRMLAQTFGIEAD
jgi:PAS domain S-box-containing protein